MAPFEMLTDDAVPAGWRVRIHPDLDAPDPRTSQDQTARLVLDHRRYRLPHEVDEVPRIDEALDRGGPQLAARYLQLVHDAVVLPVWGYEHGELSLRAGDRTGQFADRWDSGLAGLGYVTPTAIRQAWAGDYPGDQAARDLIRAEVDQLDQHIRGDVWGYTIDTWSPYTAACPHCPGGVWEHAESLWDIYGHDVCVQAALDALHDLVGKPAA